MHTAVYGMTLYGKSWLLKRRVEALKRLKQRPMIFDPLRDRQWAALGPVYTTADQFEEALGDPANAGRFVVLDEARRLYAETRRQAKYPRCNDLGAIGRHKGYTLYFATQFPTMLDPIQRMNCARAYVFRLGSRKAIKTVLEDYGLEDDRDLVGEIARLPKLHYFEITSGAYRRMRLE